MNQDVKLGIWRVSRSEVLEDVVAAEDEGGAAGAVTLAV